MTAKERKYDIRSAEPVVFYTGPGLIAGVAAGDLSANALARTAWIRGGQKGDPDQVDDKAIEAIRDELVATGHYRKTKAEPKENES